jgi:hypothetical protein
VKGRIWCDANRPEPITSKMKTRTLARRTVILTTMALVASAGFALAAYTYRCPKCGLIQTYNTPAMPKCPNDGWTMIPVQ